MSDIIYQGNFTPRNRYQFKKLHLRDESLNSLPSHPVFSKTVISQAGFYYNDGDLTCFKCGFQIRYAELTSASFNEHRDYSAICAPFQPNTSNTESEEDFVQETLEERKEIELFPIKPVNCEKPEGESSAAGAAMLGDKEALHRMLKRENQYLKEKTTCCSCKSENASYIILPCGDLGACRGCIKTIETCPICTTEVIDGSEVTFKYESGDEEDLEKEFIKETGVKGIQFLFP